MIGLQVVDRYVLRQVATPLVTAMAIGLLVLMADRMVRLLEVTLGKKNSFAVVFELLGYLVPHYLGLALPAAMFLGLLSTGAVAQTTTPQCIVVVGAAPAAGAILSDLGGNNLTRLGLDRSGIDVTKIPFSVAIKDCGAITVHMTEGHEAQAASVVAAPTTTTTQAR